MKHPLAIVTSLLGVSLLSTAVIAADQPAPENTKTAKRELRVLAAPDDAAPRAGSRTRIAVSRVGEGEKESVTFLGVITTPVSATLSAQLGLPVGSGLVVNHLEENSPAAGSLKEHDILVKLDDQLLIDQHQLSVLIRQHKEGDEVTLTYVRTGKQATAKVKLGKHDVPKMAAVFTAPLPPGAANGFTWAQGDGKMSVALPPGAGDRADVDRVLEMIESHSGQPMRMRIEQGAGPGFRAMSINTGNSNLVYSDDGGTLELTVKDGQKSLVAKNSKGDAIFTGPVNTPDERRALPEDVRQRLEKLEGMQGVTFHTDGTFQGTETRMIRPMPRGISLPGTPPAPRGDRMPIFF